MIGAYWDVSWHLSVGRDTFWTPSPHGDPALWSVGGTHVRVPDTFDDLWTQPDSAQRKASSVQIWAFRPLGAFIAAWGAFAMIISAPSTTGGITLRSRCRHPQS